MTQVNKREYEFETPLGIVRCGFIADGIKDFAEIRQLDKGSSQIFKTDGYKIEFISFKIRIPLYNGEILTDSAGWILRIEKTADTDEQIQTYCLLDKVNEGIIFDTATGESLDAIQADNDEWTLHIGTEDGEILHVRAKADDWFPARLESLVSFYQSITEMQQNGFVTTIPTLTTGEKIHIQYLVAYDRRNEHKVNTWLAVDESKRKLENWLGLW